MKKLSSQIGGSGFLLLPQSFRECQKVRKLFCSLTGRGGFVFYEILSESMT